MGVMMSYSMFLGSILLASAGISFTYGLYASYEANKSISKKLVFIICCALSVWSLGLSITVAADNEKIAMIGHLLAPIGWGLLPGLLLHFTLILTGKEKIIKKWCLYLMLYSPGLVMLFAFTILPPWAKMQIVLLIQIMGGLVSLIMIYGIIYIMYILLDSWL